MKTQDNFPTECYLTGMHNASYHECSTVGFWDKPICISASCYFKHLGREKGFLREDIEPATEHLTYMLHKFQTQEGHQNSCNSVALLKACAKLKDLDNGCKVHAQILGNGSLEHDPFISSALINMYGKCGLPTKAQEVFDKLPFHSVVSWTALISGYVENRWYQEALDCFQRMHMEGIDPDCVTYLCSLKACGSLGEIERGKEIHDEIVRKGLQRDPIIGTAMTDMYARCGLLVKAFEVFDTLLARNVISWNALIKGYAEYEHNEEALDCFNWMLCEGITPDVVTFLTILKACGSIGDVYRVQEIHVEIVRRGLFESEFLIGTTLVDTYAKCNFLAKAHEVFDKLSIKTTISWNALIAGYSHTGKDEGVLNCFQLMQGQDIPPDTVTSIFILKACGNLSALEKGMELHAQIAVKGFLETDPVVSTAVVDMYFKCGSLVKAQEVFDKLPCRNLFHWTTLIAGYVQHGLYNKALFYFEQMQCECISPDAVTFCCILKVYASIGAVEKGVEIHAEVLRQGLETNHLVGTSLVEFYCKLGLLAKAREVFNRLFFRTLASWNALVSGYAMHGFVDETLKCYRLMPIHGVSPDIVTFVSCLKACANFGALDEGCRIHAEILEAGWSERQCMLGTALVDMYGKCGSIVRAQEMFNQLSTKDTVSWNALISSLVQHGLSEEALVCVEQMKSVGFGVDTATLISSLKACSGVGILDKGQKLHAEILRSGLEIDDYLLGNALVDLYAKCGFPGRAQEIFNTLSLQDVISWNALISGYTQLGDVKNTFLAFNKMIGNGSDPDVGTYICVLNVCSHTGSVQKGHILFEYMMKECSCPTLKHYNSLVDLLGRAGQLDKVSALIKMMPIHADLAVWHTVLGACQKWNGVDLGRQVIRHAELLGI